jgi:ribulose-phosphate 3-epimerase
MPLTQLNQHDILLAPSILTADFARLGLQVQEAAAAGADWLHIDVMDGVFVPNISIGLPIVAALRRVSDLPLDCHLMITQPERYLAAFAEAGASRITVHAEATTHLHRTIQAIHDLGLPAGVALNPATPLNMLDEILPLLDLVLIMSVNPGFGGQRYIPGSTAKIARLRCLLDTLDLAHVHLQVDGGIGAANLPEVIGAGATNIVVGTAIFNERQSVAAAIGALREACIPP